MPDVSMERFRVEVGYDHGVKPGNIVGAIANEAGLDSKMIGQIEIYDRSTSQLLEYDYKLPHTAPDEWMTIDVGSFILAEGLNQLELLVVEGGYVTMRSHCGGAGLLFIFYIAISILLGGWECKLVAIGGVIFI